MEVSDATHYPEYNVLDLMDEWDSHTREIVKKRLGPFPPSSVLSEQERHLLRAVIKNITYDDRGDVGDWVTAHIEKTMDLQVGENQRKSGTPAVGVLFRNGLAAVDHLSRKEFSKDFCELAEDKQCALISSIQLGAAEQLPEWSIVPQKELFDRLASEIISAYYSHPAVWSEIGYGGPAYPRGYIRVEFGLRDPWEAKCDGK